MMVERMHKALGQPRASRTAAQQPIQQIKTQEPLLK